VRARTGLEIAQTAGRLARKQTELENI